MICIFVIYCCDLFNKGKKKKEKHMCRNITATFFRPKTIVTSFLHLIVLIFKVFINHFRNHQFVVLHIASEAINMEMSENALQLCYDFFFICLIFEHHIALIQFMRNLQGYPKTISYLISIGCN